MFRIKCFGKNHITHLVFDDSYDNRAVYEIMWKNIVEPDRPLHSFIHSVYFPYIPIQVKYQGCGNCQSSCIHIS